MHMYPNSSLTIQTCWTSLALLSNTLTCYNMSWSSFKSKGKFCIWSKWPIRLAPISGFCCMKWLRVSLLLPVWDASPSHCYPYARLPATVWERTPRSSPKLTAGLMDLALLILTNEKSACLNRAGCINYLSRSSIEVVRYEKRSR